ncbi:hypothetical protein C9374_009750 [Naegleria lovaniensis]|uniref:Uncharacterized protein n=1 Tax=Naegleria lovaniensis TaxID=51637 RepID=A0AA88KPI8_NAELO|nr:uncharacterized protein C9374_009750 [Naegleria lovaniensis]KAG2393173.1 hypothetical protein C9374_009750 [Naegleria lovaniensis]
MHRPTPNSFSSQPTERSSTTAFTSSLSGGNNNNNGGNQSITTVQISHPNTTMTTSGTAPTVILPIPFPSTSFATPPPQQQGISSSQYILQQRQNNNTTWMTTNQFSLLNASTSLNETSQPNVTSSLQNQNVHPSNMFNSYSTSGSTVNSSNYEKNTTTTTTIVQNYTPMLRLDLMDVLHTLHQEGYSVDTNEQRQQQFHQPHHSGDIFNPTNIKKDVSHPENYSPLQPHTMDMRPFSTSSSLSSNLRNELLKHSSSSSPVQPIPPASHQIQPNLFPPPTPTTTPQQPPQSSIPNITFTSPSSSSSCTVISSSLSTWSHLETEVSSSSSNIPITHTSTQNVPQQHGEQTTRAFVIHENEYEKKKAPKTKKAKSENYTNQKKMEFRMELNTTKEKKSNTSSNRFIQVVEETNAVSSSSRRRSTSSSTASSPLSPSTKVSRP